VAGVGTVVPLSVASSRPRWF